MHRLPVPFRLLLVLALAGAADASTGQDAPDAIAPRPLYRDPVHDGTADPVVVWNPHVGRWWMFYTNRRANVPGLPGVTWVHGTAIGIAESADGGTTWTHAGTAEIELPPEVAGATPTLWAPEIVTAAQASRHPIGDTGAGAPAGAAGPAGSRPPRSRSSAASSNRVARYHASPRPRRWRVAAGFPA